MERLGQRELSALLAFLRDVYAPQTSDTFARSVIRGLPRLVRSEITSYNEVDPVRRRTAMVMEPFDAAAFPEHQQIFDRHVPEHPLIAHYQRTGDGRAFKISDFLTQRQFHRLGLYTEFYRRFPVEHQMATTLPAPHPLIIGIALNRSGHDFSERDRLLLDLLRPHLIQAHRNAQAFTTLREEVAALRHAAEASHLGVVVPAPDGRIRLATDRARDWLAGYFDRRSVRADRLPEILLRWMRRQDAPLDRPGQEMPPPRVPLVVEQEGRRLIVRLLSTGDHCLLLLEEECEVRPAALESYGLTRREAEVLAWVAEGKTNAEIGAILGTRPRTVAKHLERIYQKLGVETRTAAAARARAGQAAPVAPRRTVSSPDLSATAGPPSRPAQPPAEPR